ncbi:MAG: 50S ribosomal protein L10 [Myxococcales bacterium]|nr:50S ribosomal protein L10 [Myxococcales bacterium]
MDRGQKEQVLGEIKEAFGNVVSVVLAENHGVDVPTVTDMRAEFRKNGCSFRVLKNSLVKIAVKGSEMEGMTTLLKGPTAVIWSNDTPQMPAKLALKWAKDHPKFVIKGGFYDGQVLDQAGVEMLSKLPTKDDARASLLMTFLAAPSTFAYLIDAQKRKLVEGGAADVAAEAPAAAAPDVAPETAAAPAE